MDFDVGRNDFDGDDPKNVRTRVDRTLLRIQDIRNGGVFMTSLKGRYQDFFRQYQRATSREIRSMRDRPILVERMKRIAPKIGPRGVVGPVGSVGSCDGPRGCLPNGHPDKFKSKRQLKKEKLFKRQLSQRHK